MSTTTAQKVFIFFHILNKTVITLFCAVLVAAGFTFLMMGLAPYPVDIKMSLANTTLPYNDFLILQSKNFRHQLCKTGSSYIIIDSKNYKTEITSSPRPIPGVLGQDDFSRQIRIRRSIDGGAGPAPGPAKFYFTVNWVCPGNWYQAVFPKTQIIGPMNFTILDKDIPLRERDQ